MKIAVIDLGSNTFHLLIVEKENDIFKEIFRKRIFTGLGEGGIDVLRSEAIQRCVDACNIFQKHLNNYDIGKLIITGTAALRTAKNSSEFIKKAETIFNTTIRIIDGQLEARLIFEGVKLLSPMIERTLIMDIGGGSTEFIIVEGGKMLFGDSFKLGVNVLHELFHMEEPISKENCDALQQHVFETTKLFFEQANSSKIKTIIGSSGSFEIFESMSGLPTYKDKVNTIQLKTIQTIIDKIVIANLEERQHMDGLPLQRTKLIVVGMLLVDAILKLVNPNEMHVTPYALKEGVLVSF